MQNYLTKERPMFGQSLKILIFIKIHNDMHSPNHSLSTYVISLIEIFLGFPQICTFNQKCSLGSARNLM